MSLQDTLGANLEMHNLSPLSLPFTHTGSTIGTMLQSTTQNMHAEQRVENKYLTKLLCDYLLIILVS